MPGAAGGDRGAAECERWTAGGSRGRQRVQYLRKSSMWTTAGAIFSTTSAMKLNLYRGLAACEGPTLAARIRPYNKRTVAQQHRCLQLGGLDQSMKPPKHLSEHLLTITYKLGFGQLYIVLCDKIKLLKIKRKLQGPRPHGPGPTLVLREVAFTRPPV